MHAIKVKNSKEQYIFVSSFKTYTPLILGGLREGKSSTIFERYKQSLLKGTFTLLSGVLLFYVSMLVLKED